MKKFETSWNYKFQNYVRVFNTDTNKSEVYEIDNHYEYFEPNDKGAYEYILDNNIKMVKKLGFSKDTSDKFGVRRPQEIHIRDNYWQTGYNLNPRIWYIDIETRADSGFPTPKEASKQITLIQIFDSIMNTMIVLGYRDFEMYDDYKLDYNVKYIKCINEYDLLDKYLKLFKTLNPLIIYAWNGLGFDYLYIYNRLKNLGLDPNLMSNYGEAKFTEKMARNGLKFEFSALGHFYIDMIDSYKKIIVKNQPSYTLDTIANIELGDAKVDHSEFRTFDSFYTGKDYTISKEPYNDRIREGIRQLKIKESQNALSQSDKEELDKLLQFQFVYYGIKDVYLLRKIDKKINMTNILLSMSQQMGCLFDATLGTLNPWQNYICNVCYKRNLVPPKKVENDDPYVVGGFVREPLIGKHKWVMSFDYNSMHPMNIVGFNMSAETYVPLSKAPDDLRELLLQYFNSQDEDKILNLDTDVKKHVTELLQKYNLALGINGALFKKDKQGIIPELVWDIYTSRKADKKTMLKYEKQKEIIADILLKRKNDVN